jgi:hypothetical protein
MDEQDSTMTQNLSGQWVPSIPLPGYSLFRKVCWCKRGFWTMRGYRGHFALAHIVKLRERA